MNCQMSSVTSPQPGQPGQAPSQQPSLVDLPPLASDVWKSEILDLLFFEWSVQKDKRLIDSVGKHSTKEMLGTVTNLGMGTLTPEKKSAISTNLRGCKIDPNVFSEL